MANFKVGDLIKDPAVNPPFRQGRILAVEVPCYKIFWLDKNAQQFEYHSIRIIDAYYVKDASNEKV